MKIDINKQYYVMFDTRYDVILNLKNKTMFDSSAKAILTLYNSGIWSTIKVEWLSRELNVSKAIAFEAHKYYDVYKYHLRLNRIDSNHEYAQYIDMYEDNKDIFAKLIDLKFADQNIIVKKFVEGIILED